MKKFLAAVLLVAAALSAARFFAPRPSQQAAYKDVRPAIGDVKVFISTTGIVTPQNRVELKPPVPGRIESVFVDEGQMVTQAQVLALMSSTERACLLDAARARSSEEYERWKTYCNPVPILAPLDGLIISRDVEPGQTVGAMQTVLVQSDRLIVRANVDETDIGQVRVGMEVVLSLDAYPDSLFTGRVDTVAYEARMINNVTVYAVEVLPQSNPSFMKSGMTANVDFISAVRSNVLTLPVTAMTERPDGGHEVLIKTGSGPESALIAKRIVTGLSDGKTVEIVSGLTAADVVQERVLDLSKKEGAGASTPFSMPAPGQGGGGGGPPGG
jgi:macrolide-specific efflux system membrane fusion protein